MLMNRQDRLRALPAIWILVSLVTTLVLTLSEDGWNGIVLILILIGAAIVGTVILLTPPANNPNPPIPTTELWTSREREILCLIVDGYTNEGIAQKLVIASSTVKTHINNIYRKLGVTSRAQAVRRAMDLNII
jgi:DNA-binding NarL/FixJ family response regulator